MHYLQIMHVENFLRTMSRLKVIQFVYISKQLGYVSYAGKEPVMFTIEYTTGDEYDL